MGRPSKLTEAQWAEVTKRLLAGEPRRVIARAFGISETSIRERLSAKTTEIKSVANQIVATEQAINALPISSQILAYNLADDLRAISMHMASAAKYGSATAHRLSAIAHAHVQKVDDTDPMGVDSADSLKTVAVLTKMSNDASMVANNLLAGQKEMIKEMNGGGGGMPEPIFNLTLSEE